MTNHTAGHPEPITYLCVCNLPRLTPTPEDANHSVSAVGSSSPHLTADEAESPEANHRQLQRSSQRQSALVGDDVDQSDVEMTSLQRLKQVVVAQQILAGGERGVRTGNKGVCGIEKGILWAAGQEKRPGIT